MGLSRFFQWLAVLNIFFVVVYFCIGMAVGWPMNILFIGLGVIAIFMLLAFVTGISGL
jgi:hypothetical protein